MTELIYIGRISGGIHSQVVLIKPDASGKEDSHTVEHVDWYEERHP